MKSWDALKHLPVHITEEISPRRKEKIALCVTTADTFCSISGLKTGGVNIMVLSFAVESLLQLCNDPDSDVRMTADESLNRIIRQAIMDSNVMKVQVELHKEIKRNGNARSLRAALWRFAYLSHMIRPQKGKPYVNNLMPCLMQISKRNEESVQETLATAMPQIFKALGLFTSDKDVKELLKAFLQNLSSESAQVRRTAATCIVSICLNCRKPKVFLMETLNTLVDSVVPIKENQAVSEILGLLGCLRAVLPHFTNYDEEQTGQGELQGSFGVRRGHNRASYSIDYMIQVYELSIYFSKHTDHNVVNASLELLHQLLTSPPTGLVSILLSPHGISRSQIIASPCEPSNIQRRSLSQISVAGSIAPCDENSLLDLDSDLPTAMSDAVSAPLLEKWVQDGSGMSQETNKAISCTPKANVARLQLLDAADPCEPDLPPIPERDCVTSAGDVHSTDSSPDDVRETYLLECLEQEIEMNKEITPPPSVSGISLSSPSPGAHRTEIKYQVCDIGSLTDGSIPLVYCARHLATSFLLTGHPGYRMPDRNVRVSVKALALNCVAAIVKLHPNVFQLYLDKDPISPSRRSSTGGNSSQPLCELLLFTKHTDPQLRAICCALLAALVRSVLVQSGGNWQSWQRKADAKVAACLALPRLMQYLIQGLEDESSTTCRQTLVALSQCFSELLKSRDSQEIFPILPVLCRLAQNPYWLVKVKLLELVSDLQYVVIHYVTGSSTFQDKIFHEVLLDLLKDDDNRVRHVAAEAIVRIIPNLFYPVDRHNVNEVITAASDMSDAQLRKLLEDSEPLSSSTYGRSFQKIPRLDNLTPPFNAWNKAGPKAEEGFSVQSALSRVVDTLSLLLLESSSKYLTMGCCETLSLLAERYSPATHMKSWNCIICTLSAPKLSSKREFKRIFSDGSTGSSFSAASGLLQNVLSLLLTNPSTLELGAQQWLNTLTGNLFCGVALANMHPVENPPPGVKLESNSYSNQLWSMFKDKQVSISAESLLLHVMRTLSIISHILEDSQPTASGNKPGLPSLSPIKRHGSSVGKTSTIPGDLSADVKSGRGMSPIKNIIHGEKEEKTEERKSSKSSPFGSFVNNQHYVKLFELLRSSYTNYKTSLETDMCDKFVGLVSSTLKVLSQLLEVMTLNEAGRIAEELLLYLRSTMSLSPAATVHCVSQLLKCVVGMNLVSFWDNFKSEDGPLQQVPSVGNLNDKCSGYFSVSFQEPYRQLSQFLAAASATKSQNLETLHATILNKNLRHQSDSKLACKMADTTFLASYIRLFEPMVIESLQQYTVTSDVQLQVKVLSLLTQLVQLRVNYCLLDSEMVFIGFVQKQFEFIEEGQILNAEDLIMCIFHFMVLLSFEKHHSKSITSIPKVIQLCDGLMASGQNPLTHCIPALLPVVEHGFISKASLSSGTIDAEELETQREVMVAMLLRLVEYHQVMKLLSIVLVECRTWPEGEERWRRWSRQVCDAILGLLTCGRLKLDSCDAQKALHQLLLHSLAPSVFMPVDPLLKVLFSPPPQSDSSIRSVIRWLGTILAVTLVLVAQGKEDATLARLEELEIVLPALFLRGNAVHLVSPDPLNVAAIATTPLTSSTPELTFARLVLRVIGLVGEKIDSIVMDPASSPDLLKDCHYLEELLAHFLLVCIHMFQSGSHRKIGRAAVELVAGHATEDSLLLEDANAVFLELASTCPLLMFLWCYLLTLLNYGNHAFWARVLPSIAKDSSKKDECKPCLTSNSINVELVRTGAIIVYCDFMCENSCESEQLVWFLKSQMLNIVELSSEFPVQQLIAVLHRSPEHSSLMLEAVKENFFPPNKAKPIIGLLKCLEGVHPSCRGSLLLLLAEHYVGHAHPAVARRAAQLCTRQAEYLLTLPSAQVSEQLTREQLRDILHSFRHSCLDRKQSGLVSILNKLGSQCLALSPLESDQVRPLSPVSLQNLKLDKEWYLSQVRLRCSQASCTGVAVEESTHLLGRLDLEDAVSVLSSPDTHLSILQLCFRHGTHQTLQASILLEHKRNIEDMLSPLYRASRMVLMQRVHHLTELVPKDHQVFLPVGRPPTNAEQAYSQTLLKILANDLKIDSLFCIAAAVSSYVYSLDKLGGVVPSEAAEDLVTFAILCLEAIHSQFSQSAERSTIKAERLRSDKKNKSLSVDTHDPPSALNFGRGTLISPMDKKFRAPQPHCLELGLACASRVLCEPTLGAILEHPKYSTRLASACSAISAIVHFATLGEPLPLISNDGLNEALSKPEALNIAHACHQISILVTWLEKHCFNRVCQNIPPFLSAPIKKLIVQLSRTSPLNSYVLTPPEVWKHGWTVTLKGPYNTQVPPLPTEFLQDIDILRQFIFRVILLGWTSRQQFEETWMSLLSVLSADSSNENMPSEDVAIETEASSAVIEAITALLLQTLSLPTPGNPSVGQLMHCPRDISFQFTSNSPAGKLHAIQQILLWKEEGLHGKKHFSVFDRPNLEHFVSLKRFRYGQVSVEYLQYALERSQDGVCKKQFSTSVIETFMKRYTALETSGVDVNSCLYFLLDLCTQWTQPQLSGMSGSSRPLHEVLCSVLAVSDLFTEQSQWQWLLQTCLELTKSQPVEDDILQQYVILGQCKACAVLQPDIAVYDRIMRTLDMTLRSSFVPTVTASLHGLIYMLQGCLLAERERDTEKPDGGDNDAILSGQEFPSSADPSLLETTRNVVILVAEYISKKLVSNSNLSVNEEPNIILWSLAFHLLDNFSRCKIDALEQAVSIILPQAITFANPNSRISPTLQRLILQGLERLVVSQSGALSVRTLDQITTLVVESIADPNPGVFFNYLQLLLSCMYMGHEGQTMVSKTNTGISEIEKQLKPTDPEQLILAMEKTSALFDRIKKGYPQEVELVCSVLPNLLTDFFPASEVLTKVVGEFLSQQQPHPRLLAGVVFQVFECAVAQSQLSLLQEWLVLSLSNFTQTLPVPMATWCLTCFFISASCNPWLRALFPHVQSRIGRCEYEDRKLLCLSAADFYHQLTCDIQKKKFLSTFQSAASKEPSSPYSEILSSLS